MQTAMALVARDPVTQRYWDGEDFRARNLRAAKPLEGMALVSVRYCFEAAEFLEVNGDAVGPLRRRKRVRGAM